jgi:hypothetical protein
MSDLLGYTDAVNFADQASIALPTCSTSRIGATAVGREVGDGGVYFDCRTAASVRGKKDPRWPLSEGMDPRTM